MIGGFVRNRIEKSSWFQVAFFLTALLAYSWWAFGQDSPWTRALEAAGGVLPEMRPGLPAIEPARSMEALEAAGAIGDYLVWQAADIPYAFLNLFAMSTAMGLALRKTGLGGSPARRLLYAPVVYLITEFIENAMVAGYAGALIPREGNIVLLQQAATTVKLATGWGSSLLALIALFAAAIADLVGLIRGRGRR